MTIVQEGRGVVEKLEEQTHHQNLSSTTSCGRLVGIKELVDGGLHAVPLAYVRPPHERPTTSSSSSSSSSYAHLQSRIPVIDLAALVSCNYDIGADHDLAAKTQVIREIGRACEEWGFFQVINHGVEFSVIQGLRDAARKFYNLPAEERVRFHRQKFRASVNYTTSFNPALEKVREWRDTLSFSRFPGICDGFQEAPNICKKQVQEYIGGVEALARMIYMAIFESVGFEKEYIEKEVPSIPRVLMGINYYPPCPDPSLTLGLSSHSDVGCLTILHPDVVPGLEIKHKGTWVPVFPVDPSAFVVNLADQTEISDLDKWEVQEHRA